MEMRIPTAVLEARPHPVTLPATGGLELTFSPQLKAHFDKDTRAIWSRWTADPRPCFNASLLADIRAYYEFITDSRGVLACEGEDHPIEYVVLASGMAGVFNLGGDLDLFKQ